MRSFNVMAIQQYLGNHKSQVHKHWTFSLQFAFGLLSLQSRIEFAIYPSHVYCDLKLKSKMQFGTEIWICKLVLSLAIWNWNLKCNLELNLQIVLVMCNVLWNWKYNQSMLSLGWMFSASSIWSSSSSFDPESFEGKSTTRGMCACSFMNARHISILRLENILTIFWFILWIFCRMNWGSGDVLWVPEHLNFAAQYLAEHLWFHALHSQSPCISCLQIQLHE